MSSSSSLDTNFPSASTSTFPSISRTTTELNADGAGSVATSTTSGLSQVSTSLVSVVNVPSNTWSDRSASWNASSTTMSSNYESSTLSTNPAVLVSSTSATSATSTIDPSNNLPHAQSSDSWLSIATFSGAVAGSFTAGALVAGLLVFSLLKKRPKPESERYTDRSIYSSNNDLAYIGAKGLPTVTVTALVEPGFLPQQLEDAEVKRRILSLTDQIDQHVEYFYHNRNIKADGNVEAKMACYETQQMPNSLAACFELATHPLALIKHCLAFHIFSQTIAPGEDTELILPTEIAGMVSAMYQKCLSPNTSRDTITAFSLWKNVVGYLRADEGTRTSRTASNAAMNFVKQFGAAFSAWSDAQYSEDHRNHHLAALVDDAIDTGVWLFRQPDNYKFSWNMLSYNGRTSSAITIARETVVVPEVSKMTHEGVLLAGRGQTIVQAVVKGF